MVWPLGCLEFFKLLRFPLLKYHKTIALYVLIKLLQYRYISILGNLNQSVYLSLFVEDS